MRRSEGPDPCEYHRRGCELRACTGGDDRLLSKPTVSLVIGDSHSIGVPLAVASDYSLIVPTGTMLVHPVRMSGMVIGTAQTYEYFEMIEERIISFVSEHSRIDREKMKRLMHNTKMLTKDLGRFWSEKRRWSAD